MATITSIRVVRATIRTRVERQTIARALLRSYGDDVDTVTLDAIEQYSILMPLLVVDEPQPWYARAGDKQTAIRSAFDAWMALDSDLYDTFNALFAEATAPLTPVEQQPGRSDFLDTKTAS